MKYRNTGQWRDVIANAWQENAESESFAGMTLEEFKFHNPMRRQCQFTVKQSAVSPKCAVRSAATAAATTTAAAAAASAAAVTTTAAAAAIKDKI